MAAALAAVVWLVNGAGLPGAAKPPDAEPSGPATAPATPAAQASPIPGEESPAAQTQPAAGEEEPEKSASHDKTNRDGDKRNEPGGAKTKERAPRRDMNVWIELPAKDWRAGPVRYILTRNEDKAFKRLRTDAERASFIERFWQRRDPTPGTEFNEFRSQFHSRVASANELFKDSSYPGWKTDRGKIYILLGPPDDIIQDTMARENRGTILWTYRNTARADLGPSMVVPFAKDETGEFVLTVRPSDVANPSKGLAPNNPNFGVEAWLYGPDPANNPNRPEYWAKLGPDPLLVSHGVFSGSSDLSLLGDLTKLQLPDYQVLNEQVVTRAFYGKVPLRARVDYFKATQERTFLTLTLAVRSSALQFRRDVMGGEAPDVAISARIVSDSDPQQVTTLESLRHFVPSPRNAVARYDQDLLWQARVALQPGLYKASFVLEDRVRGSVATHQTNLEVPDFYDPGLQMSSVVLADRLEPAPDGSDPGRTPFVLGRWLLVPQLDPEMASSREAALYFQVYNARRDPATNLPSLDVTYRFYVLRQDHFEPLSQPIVLSGQTSEVHAYAVPLSTFPAGSYMVRTEVRDNLAGASTFRETLFKVQEATR